MSGFGVEYNEITTTRSCRWAVMAKTTRRTKKDSAHFAANFRECHFSVAVYGNQVEMWKKIECSLCNKRIVNVMYSGNLTGILHLTQNSLFLLRGEKLGIYCVSLQVKEDWLQGNYKTKPSINRDHHNFNWEIVRDNWTKRITEDKRLQTF